jgi:hypothetical protein
MYITTIAKVLSTGGTDARGSGIAGYVDVSMVRVKKDSYAEVFAHQTIGRITRKVAKLKRDVRLQFIAARNSTAYLLNMKAGGVTK